MIACARKHKQPAMYLETCIRRSLVRPFPLCKIAFARESGPQGLRRPRFSFFRLTCQTARNQGGSCPRLPEGGRSVTAPDTIGSLITLISEVLRRRAIAPRRAAHHSVYYIEPARLNCQHRNRSYPTPKSPIKPTILANFSYIV